MPPASEPSDVLWRKSTRSGEAGNCVEVARRPESVAVRDSKNPDGPRLEFVADTWRDFIGSVRAGAFDRPGAP